MREGSWQEELEAYFAGLDGEMGMRSWLGRWEDHGPTRGGTGSASPPEHDAKALAAARRSSFVRGALRRLSQGHVLVLEAMYAPHPPHAFDLLRPSLAQYAPVACVIEGRLRLEALVAEKRAKNEASRAAGRELRRVRGAAEKATRDAVEAYHEARGEQYEAERDSRRTRRRASLEGM